FDVPVEAADGIEPRVDVADEVGDDWATARILDRSHVPGGLVQDEVLLGLRARQRTAVDGDDVALGIGQRAELAGHGAVDGDAAVGDEPVSSPPAAEPRLRQDLVEPELRHRPSPPPPRARGSRARPRSSYVRLVLDTPLRLRPSAV